MGDASGYEIEKFFEGPFSHVCEASYGSIYPSLQRLTGEGLVTCEAFSQEKRPDKKVYSLTQAGRAALLEDLSAIPGPDRVRSDFLITMIFAHLLPPSHVAEVIDGRIATYRALLDDLESGALKGPAGGDAGGIAFTRAYGVAMIKASLEFIEQNRHLVEGAALLRAPAAE
jgi:DNA-binding PadR family transcriptional regulator